MIFQRLRGRGGVGTEAVAFEAGRIMLATSWRVYDNSAPGRPEVAYRGPRSKPTHRREPRRGQHPRERCQTAGSPAES